MLATQLRSIVKSLGTVIPPKSKALRRTRRPSGDAALELLRRGNAAHERRQYYDALALWKQSAELGNSQAQYKIGNLYSLGQGVITNVADAAAWYKRAAEAGHAKAQFRLGFIYLNAATGTDNLTTWFRSASKNNQASRARQSEHLIPKWYCR